MTAGAEVVGGVVGVVAVVVTKIRMEIEDCTSEVILGLPL